MITRTIPGLKSLVQAVIVIAIVAAVAWAAFPVSSKRPTNAPSSIDLGHTYWTQVRGKVYAAAARIHADTLGIRDPNESTLSPAPWVPMNRLAINYLAATGTDSITIAVYSGDPAASRNSAALIGDTLRVCVGSSDRWIEVPVRFDWGIVYAVTGNAAGELRVLAFGEK